MIVVGILVPGAPSSAVVVEIARRAAATGARTELVGVVPAGAAGDRRLVELAAAGVGHATVTRSTAPGLEPADLELALRYLPDIHAIVLIQPEVALLATASAASSWSGATQIVVGTTNGDVGATGPVATDSATGSVASEPIVLQPPARDPDGAFAGLVAALAVRLDAGEAPTAAWQATLATLAVDPA